MSKKNLLIFGCDFFREKKSSEINFWNDISDYFSHHFNEIVILSVNNRKVQQEMIGENIYLYNVPTCFLKNPGTWENSEYTGKRFQKLPLSIVYKSYTFWRLQPIFDSIIDRHKIGIVHYMRIFGLLNKLLIKRYPDILFSITVPTHIDRGFPLHLFYHTIKNIAIKPMDRIIPTSEATRHKLITRGLPPKKLKTIHWSSNVNDESPSTKNVRNELGLTVKTQIILWSGPLQDANKKEFFFARSVAKKVLEKTKRFSFVFAFKPCTLKPEYLSLDRDISYIKILETDFNTFCALKREAVLFLSPICNKNRTVAPAITWIEVMQLGLPVMTTNIDGVTELIKHGETGFIINNVDEAVSIILDFETTEPFRNNCRNVIKQKYNIKNIAEQYIYMWTEANKDLKKKQFKGGGQ
jgi:glycosyltransferase involved in cell wall biosynthesis